VVAQTVDWWFGTVGFPERIDAIFGNQTVRRANYTMQPLIIPQSRPTGLSCFPGAAPIPFWS